MIKEFSKLCLPAKVYFAIALFAIVVALFNNMPLLASFVKLVFAFIWTFVLNWLCSKGYTSISWFLVLLPYIIIVLVALGLMRAAKKQSSSQQKVVEGVDLRFSAS
jgi:ABC-type uncharacterized transport system permease subunit